MASTVSLRAIEPSDLDRIEAWLKQPDIQRWRGDPASSSAELRLVMESPSALCRMIEAEGIAIGYGHVADAAISREALRAALPPETWMLDLFVADPANRGLGHGEAAIRALVGELFATTLALAVAVLPPVRNEAAVRAYERIGFRWLRVVVDPILGPSWLMLLDRPSNGLALGPAPFQTSG
jgi:RimJ/RimL family protein N-acetyltransferase